MSLSLFRQRHSSPPARFSRHRLPVAVLIAGALIVSSASPAAAFAPGVSVPATQRSALAKVAADPQLSIPGFDVDDFQNPTSQKPAVLWFWDRLQTEAQIDAKLESVHAAGFTETVIFRWLGDIPEAYFSQAWFDRVEHLLSKSRELGMTVWLDNDDKFPSGSAGGFIVNGGTVGDKTYAPHPELKVKSLGSAGSTIRQGGGTIDLANAFGSSIQLDDGNVVADSGSAPGITLLRDGAEWSNYSVKAKFSIVRATAGLMVRSSDTNNGYLVDVRDDGKVDVWNQSNGNFSVLRVGSTTRPGWSPTGSHDIAISLDGPSIAITLDGVAEPALSDTTHTAGTVGMRVAGNQAWRLDSLATTALPGGEELYSNDYSDDSSVGDFDVVTKPLENVVAVAARPASGAGLTDPSKVIDITADYTSTGTWNAPAGSWRIEAYRYNVSGGDRAEYADTMSIEAQNLYTKIVFDEYYERFADYFGSTLVGFADDEPEMGNYRDDNPPWTPALAGRLADSGLNPAAVITSVFNDLGAKGTELRADYYRAASDQWVDAYWKTKYDWADAHGISVLSNPLYDEYGPAGRLHESGNLLTMHQWAQVPGTDLISNQVENGMVRNLPYEPASVAHQLGRPLVYDELMGATGWQKSLADVRQGTASSAVRGINKALFHATFDADETASFPPRFSDKNVWWKFMPQVNDWTGRLMEFGRHTTAAKTAVVQMQRAAEAAQRGDQSKVDDPFFAVEHSLEDNQVDFDLLDEGALSDDPAILAHATVGDGGELVVGKMSYSAVVVPTAPVVSLEAVQRLKEFVDAGGRVVFAGGAPAAEIEGRDTELASTVAAIVASGGNRVVTTTKAASAGAAAAGLGQAGVELGTASASVRVLRFQEGTTAGYELLNEGAAAVTTTVTFPTAGVPVKWDPDTGDVTEFSTYSAGAKSTAVPMTLLPNVPVGVTVSPQMEPSAHATRVTGVGTVDAVTATAGSARVTVRSDETGRTDVRATDGDAEFAGSVVTPALPDEVALSGDWTMTLGNGADAVTRPLKSWTDLAPTYSGTAVYTRSVSLTAEQVKANWTLDLGRVANTAEVTLNGKAVGTRIAAPFTVDLADGLVAGSNTIQVTVTNTDGNSKGIISDSGLLGPVALSPYTLTTKTLASTAVQVTAASARMDASGEFARGELTVSNPGTAAVSGIPSITGKGWTTENAKEVTIAAGATVTLRATVVPASFIPNGDVALSASFVVGADAADTRALTLDASFPTPPATASDHVDFGDPASETAHRVTGSATSGTNTEAGLTRRYGGYRVPDAWFQTELAVTSGRAFVLQATETYNADPQQKSYRVFVDGELVATRLNVRDLREEGTASYRLVVPAGLVKSDRVTVRFQSRSNPDYADPSLADVWAVGVAGDSVAPTVTAKVASDSAGENGWVRGPATVTLAAEDSRTSDPAIEYNAGSGWKSYAAPIAVTAQGRTVVSYRATDEAGNVSPVSSTTVSLDSVAPKSSVAIKKPAAPGVVYSPAVLTIAATDATSGVETTRYRVDGGAWVVGKTVTITAAGKHTVTASATDVAGNPGAETSLAVTVKAAKPVSNVKVGAVSRSSGATTVKVRIGCLETAARCVGTLKVGVGHLAARASYSIAHGTSKTISVKIPSSMRKSLLKHNVLVTITAKSGKLPATVVKVRLNR